MEIRDTEKKKKQAGGQDSGVRGLFFNNIYLIIAYIFV